MFTVNIDGTDLYPLNLEDMSSHYTWVSDREIINFSNRYIDGWQYHLFTDQTRQVKTIAKDIFPGDGHCSYSPDGRWMMTDCYPEPDALYRKLFLYDLEKEIPYEIGEFADDMSAPGPTRCDLHPNWSQERVYIDTRVTGPGGYQVVLSTDHWPWGGQDRVSEDYIYYTGDTEFGYGIRLYLPCRTGVALKKVVW